MKPHFHEIIFEKQIALIIHTEILFSVLVGEPIKFRCSQTVFILLERKIMRNGRYSFWDIDEKSAQDNVASWIIIFTASLKLPSEVGQINVDHITKILYLILQYIF